MLWFLDAALPSSHHHYNDASGEINIGRSLSLVGEFRDGAQVCWNIPLTRPVCWSTPVDVVNWPGRSTRVMKRERLQNHITLWHFCKGNACFVSGIGVFEIERERLRTLTPEWQFLNTIFIRKVQFSSLGGFLAARAPPVA